MTKRPEVVIAEELEDVLTVRDGAESDLSSAQQVIDALTDYGYKIIRYAVVSDEEAAKRRAHRQSKI